ncbi:mitochondrial ribosomal protein, large subunit [Candida dubliniensis CD36]|uniref:Large ribosomal subunit protein uL30m n=1 Tax=Candida dubliniensis (strain CD36 / ATCC MYA-646 / CBS 7987 / NCPF 3949 / NRRL Y-17841) TaxID=573826 RepID=B9WD78_CANDC|nr:mitochondrial ribosomal protein, large subunit [Candida dubliniensis CD36]CAX42628.1 mitochondrial ribosomal protein, large subunit [Candida dubliniensis CD36]
MFCCLFFFFFLSLCLSLFDKSSNFHHERRERFYNLTINTILILSLQTTTHTNTHIFIYIYIPLTMSTVPKQLYYRITQIRSSIGMPPKTRNTLTSLGLKRRFQVTYVKVDQSSAHQLALVKELVKVELSEEKKTRQEINQERKYKPGFELIKDGMKKTYT